MRRSSVFACNEREVALIMFFSENKRGAVEWLVVGLGNIGAKYDLTRHNAGFMAIDRLAAEHGCNINKSKSKALYGKCDLAGHSCLLVKPQTYMNNSGEAVGALAKFYKVPAERVLIVCDDISLDVGRLRIRTRGSDGGHNGLKSIAMYIGDSYARIKLGVGKKPHPDYDLAAWVLSKFTPAELEALDDATARACRAAELIVSGETDRAMNLFN